MDTVLSKCSISEMTAKALQNVHSTAKWQWRAQSIHNPALFWSDTNGIPLVAMEYVSGSASESVHERLVDLGVGMSQRTLTALAHAHARESFTEI